MISIPKKTGKIKLGITKDTIQPFIEAPSISQVLEKLNDSFEKNDDINATELFSLFTANIIKEKVIFTR